MLLTNDVDRSIGEFEIPTGSKTSAHDYLLTQRSAHRYTSEVQAMVQNIGDLLSRQSKPFTGITPAELMPTLDKIDLDRTLGSLNAVMEELHEVYLKDAVYFHTPKYAAHLNCPITIPALAAEVVVSALNTSMDTWDQSAGATLVERKLLSWSAERLGLGAHADGIFTSGGTQSNFQALLMAREHARRTRPGRSLDDFRVFTSADSHFSVQKSCFLLGLGYEAAIAVPTDADHRMDLLALTKLLEQTQREGLIPIAVVATAGTTDFGAIDPLAEICELAHEAQAWAHVDAAYGGGLITSLRNRDLLKGIENADSVTIDFHKTFFQPISSSAILVRDAANLSAATYHADYLNPASASPTHSPNQVNKSLQTTRRFDALKLWMTLRAMGADGIGQLLDELLDLTAKVHARLSEDPDFEVLPAGALSTLVFRYAPSDLPAGVDLNQLNRDIRAALMKSGEGMVAGTSVQGQIYCKFTLLNPEASPSSLMEIVDLLRTHGQELIAKQTVGEN